MLLGNICANAVPLQNYSKTHSHFCVKNHQGTACQKIFLDFWQTALGTGGILFCDRTRPHESRKIQSSGMVGLKKNPTKLEKHIGDTI